MSILKSKKIAEMSEKDLTEKKRELQLELSKEMALSEVGGSVKNPGRIKEIKKTIARILTVQSKGNVKKQK